MKTILILLLFVNITVCSAQPYVSWTNTYYNASNGDYYEGNDIALVDTFTYVAGSLGNFYYNSSSFYLLKLNGHGDTMWSAGLPGYYVAPNFIGDGTQIIASDNAGNIYVAGTFKFAEDNYAGDYLLIKYNANGDTVWTRKFNGSGNSADVAEALTLDKAGNIIITGLGHVGGVNGDCVTLKYDRNGNRLWMKSFDSGNTHWDDDGYKIAVDNNDDIFIACDFGVLKYDSSGNLKWSKVAALFTSDGEGVNVKIDKDQNVVYSTNVNNEIIKYDQQGDLLTSAIFSLAGYSDVGLYGLAIDNDDNIIVSGVGIGATTSEMNTIKYDSSLNQLWQKTLPDNSPNYITTDLNNNIYIAGDDSFNLIKYSPSGVLLWDKVYPPVSPAAKIVMDTANNIYMTGELGINSGEMFTIKYSVDSLISAVRNNFIQNNYVLNFYPNPSNGVFSFFSTQLYSTQLIITNLMGEQVYSSPIISNKTEIDLSQQPKDIYFYRLQNDNRALQTGKIIIN